jgi:anti-sigma B factor antagonist
VDLLAIKVNEDESGPVIRLSGEADLTAAARLNEVLSAHALGTARQVTVDVAGLRFADSASIRELIWAHRVMSERGATLVLADPQPTVAKALSLLGVDHMLTIRPGSGAPAGSTQEKSADR